MDTLCRRCRQQPQPQCRACYMRRWNRRNPLKGPEQRQRHRDKRNAQSRAWRARNRERVAEYNRATRAQWAPVRAKWKRDHPHVRSEHQARRVALVKQTYRERVDYAAIRARDADTCYICERFVPRDQLVFDHVIPILKGGPHIAENLRVTHRGCNSRKGSRVVSFFEALLSDRAA